MVSEETESERVVRIVVAVQWVDNEESKSVRNPEQNLTGNAMMSPRVVARQRLCIGSHRDLFRVSAALVLWLSLLLFVVSQPWVIETFTSRLALGISYVLGVLLQLLGNEIERVGVIIRNDALSMEINHKCTAVYQVAVYCAGVLAYRTRLRNKAVGLFWGICVISIANILRIVAIFYVGVYTPEWIPFVHNVLGEVLMIGLVLISWFLWARRIAGAAPGVVSKKRDGPEVLDGASTVSVLRAFKGIKRKVFN